VWNKVDSDTYKRKYKIKEKIWIDKK
jgi:hypothetical protein